MKKIFLFVLITGLMINPVLFVYGKFARWTAVNFDIASRCFYDIVCCRPIVITGALLMSAALTMAILAATRLMSRKTRMLILAFVVLTMSIFQIPRCHCDPIFGGDEHDARDSFIVQGFLTVPPSKGTIALKSNPKSFVLALVSKNHEVRPYEVFNFEDMFGIVQNTNTTKAFICFQPPARERLALCLDRYTYDRVDFYVRGSLRFSKPVIVNSVGCLEFWDNDSDGSVDEFKSDIRFLDLGVWRKSAYDDHDLNGIVAMFSDSVANTNQLPPVGMMDEADLHRLVDLDMDGQPPLDKNWKVSDADERTPFDRLYYIGGFDRSKLTFNSDCKGFRLCRTDKDWCTEDLEAVADAYPNLTNVYLSANWEDDDIHKYLCKDLDLLALCRLKSLKCVECSIRGQIKNADAIFNSTQFEDCFLSYVTGAIVGEIDNGKRNLDEHIEWSIAECIEGRNVDFEQKVSEHSKFIRCPFRQVTFINKSSVDAKVKRLPKGVHAVRFIGRFDFSECEPNPDIECFEWTHNEYRCPDPERTSFEWYFSENRTPGDVCWREKCLSSLDLKIFSALRFVCIDAECNCLNRIVFDVDRILENKSVKYMFLKIRNGYIRNVEKLYSSLSHAEVCMCNISKEAIIKQYEQDEKMREKWKK